MKKNVSDQESDAAIEEWPVRPYSKSELALCLCTRNRRAFRAQPFVSLDTF